MKVTSEGFEIAEIGERVHSLASDGDGVFVLKVRRGGDNIPVETPTIPASEIDALIDALQEAKRLLGGEGSPAESRPLGLKDCDGDTWVMALNGGWTTNSDGTEGQTREYVEREWGPVTEIWSAEG